MSPENKDKSIKITLDDLANVSLPDAGALAPVAQGAGGAKVYGSISETSDRQTQIAEEKGNFLLQGWFYLGLAGMLGAIAVWSLEVETVVSKLIQSPSAPRSWLARAPWSSSLAMRVGSPRPRLRRSLRSRRRLRRRCSTLSVRAPGRSCVPPPGWERPGCTRRPARYRPGR